IHGVRVVEIDPRKTFANQVGQDAAHRISGEEEVLQTFADVLYWLNDEGLIRVKSAQEFEGG
ncbi:hypothetical protein ACC758_38595, partial [Rhizobium ruizarguesonis]